MAGQARSSSGIDIDSAAFHAGLARALGDLRGKGEKALERTALDVQNRARQFSPVDTGRLRSSIRYKMGKDSQGPYADVGTNVKYAPHVEFGTSRSPAQPYLRPALAEAVRVLLREMDAR